MPTLALGGLAAAGSRIRWLTASLLCLALAWHTNALDIKYWPARLSFSRRVQWENPPSGTWGATCTWIKSHTPQDAIFIIPPHLRHFNLWAERAAVFVYARQVWLPHSLQEWRKRLDEMTGIKTWGMTSAAIDQRFRQVGQGYFSLPPTKLQALCQKYHATHLVFSSAPLLPWGRRIYRNDDYAVYELESSSSTSDAIKLQ